MAGIVINQSVTNVIHFDVEINKEIRKNTKYSNIQGIDRISPYLPTNLCFIVSYQVFSL